MPALHFIPTSSSSLTLVERFFDTITEIHIRRGVFSFVNELESKLTEYIEMHNRNLVSYLWIKYTEEILEKVVRARSVLLWADYLR